VLKSLTGTKFEITFVQDRDGMPDFIVSLFLKAQEGDGITPHLLERHEIESYLIEPALIETAARQVGRKVTEAQAIKAVLEAAGALKAEARTVSHETAKGVNRHLEQGDQLKDKDLEIKVNAWFDGLDLTSLDVVRRVFPGRELLRETLKLVNVGSSKQITRGNLVASVSKNVVSIDLQNLLEKLG
jgi:hypothetical protein